MYGIRYLVFGELAGWVGYGSHRDHIKMGR